MPRHLVFILCALFLAACQPANPATATVFAPAIQTAAAISANAAMTQTAAPSLTPSPTVTRINSPTITLTPTITVTYTPSPTVGDSLNASAFIDDLEALNGHSMQKITGWDSGFAGDSWAETVKSSYQWLDSNHLLLHTRIGRQESPIPHDITRPAVINLNTAKFWTPMMDEHWNNRHYLPRWSAELGILITAQGDETFTYSPDGKIVKTYKNRLFGVSPSGTKILVDDDTWIDLSSEKTIDFNWDMDFMRDDKAWPIWSPNEKRVWRCCYHYGDADAGEGLDIPEKDIDLGGPLVDGSLHAFYGRWLGNDYFLPESGWEDMRPFDSLGFIPIFDPAAKTFRNLVEYAGLPANFNDPYLRIEISPQGDSLKVFSQASSVEQREYVLDLKTLQIKLYRVVSFTFPDSGEIISKLQVFSASGEEIQPASTRTSSAQMRYSIYSAWNADGTIQASITADEQQKQTLTLFYNNTLSSKEIALPIEFHETYSQATQLFWSPNGSRIALLSVDGSLWQIDYPGLKNLEQLTEPMPPKTLPNDRQEARVKDVAWSPDDRFLAFLGDTDIYIVDTRVTSD